MRKLVIGLTAAVLVTGLAACNKADETTATTEATTEAAPAMDAATTEAAPTDATSADTAATDAAQTSRSLLLAPTAEADSRPWLEIFADDVKCTHGATVGRLDEEAMFYMRSRGIAERDARAMLIGGFVNEIIEGVRPETLRAYLEIATARVGTHVQETTR